MSSESYLMDIELLKKKFEIYYIMSGKLKKLKNISGVRHIQLYIFVS